ncbi:ROK family protein [Georgenia muralis]|uniref:Putative NBD/HSP70 family sugar kinase n=1 Tax=Georgenia muralis TaxID=154117 RepID=A0A3N4Z5F9_9MICO|nr:ROK family protein [Georgenia muralis]RPF27016.1 putative NBD/HSP70 family sugar kinase [Georgenia muralis]
MAGGGHRRPPGSRVGDVFELVRLGLAQTRGDIQDLTGLSRVTVAQRVNALLDGGFLVEGGSRGSTGGRRPVELRVNVDHARVLSAVVDTTHTRVALTNLVGDLQDDEQLDIAVDGGPDPVLQAIEESMRTILRRRGLTTSDLAGVGISVPGPVDPRTNRPSEPPIMPGWDAYPVAEHLHDTFPVPVVVENDANAMALGEHAAHYPDCPSVVLVKVSTGIGTGIVLDGEVYRGVDGGAGDIGHVRLVEHMDAVCRCGSHGCLAAVASGHAVAESLRAAGREARSGRDVRRLLDAGDLVAAHGVRTAGRLVGQVMATVVTMLNPAVLVLGGDLATAPLLAGVRESLYPLTLPRATRNLDVRLSGLGTDSAVIGMAHAVAGRVYSPAAIEASLS